MKSNRRYGPIAKLFAPDWADRLRCQTPFKFIEQHTVWVGDGMSGYFALCVKCWDGCTPEQRVIYYERERRRVWAHEVSEPALRAAVLKDGEAEKPVDAKVWFGNEEPADAKISDWWLGNHGYRELTADGWQPRTWVEASDAPTTHGESR